MSKLEHISKYLNDIKVEIENYDHKLTEVAEHVSSQVKEIQDKLSNISVEPFSYSWEIDDADGDHAYPLSAALSWSGSKVLFIFEDQKAESVLGQNREIRVAVGKHLLPFLEKGLEVARNRVREITSDLE
jgi:hypothetical protein